jgi:hypothetical protein
MNTYASAQIKQSIQGHWDTSFRMIIMGRTCLRKCCKFFNPCSIAVPSTSIRVPFAYPALTLPSIRDATEVGVRPKAANPPLWGWPKAASPKYGCVRAGYANGARMERGWYANGTRMEPGFQKLHPFWRQISSRYYNFKFTKAPFNNNRKGSGQCFHAIPPAARRLQAGKRSFRFTRTLGHHVSVKCIRVGGKGYRNEPSMGDTYAPH